jgi:hypothetical protein
MLPKGPKVIIIAPAAQWVKSPSKSPNHGGPRRPGGSGVWSTPRPPAPSPTFLGENGRKEPKKPGDFFRPWWDFFGPGGDFWGTFLDYLLLIEPVLLRPKTQVAFLAKKATKTRIIS